ncbi:site-specific integrase [Streptomyces sp. NPDC001851]|uniref:site-specific integrase n=1 Tax=Streptomyces sp. NPDC001851 TaxID=3154529 RepID=UPI0033250E27
MLLISFSREGWEQWGLDYEPLIPERMPILIDDDLRFEDESGPRATVVANTWLRELPINKVPAWRSWWAYARALLAWLEFLQRYGVDPYGDREELRAALGGLAEYRLAGPLKERWDVETWNQRVNAMSRFYGWCVDNEHCMNVPFTYSWARRFTETGGPREVRRNNASIRRAQRHVTMKYLEEEFAELFVNALAGLGPDGMPSGFRGRMLGRNAAVATFVLSAGLRAQEFTYLLRYEVPGLPPRRTPIPVPLPLSRAVTKGKKARESWVMYDALARMHQYLDLDREIAASRGLYVPGRGPGLEVRDPDWEGGHVDGLRRAWRLVLPDERLRLVDEAGCSPLVALQSTGVPFTDWDTVFRRTSRRIRRDFEPRFPIVSAHTLRHTMAMATLKRLTQGYYEQAARLVLDTDEDAALALYLTRTEPLLVLRDILGHSSVLTTELYVRRLDVRRIYREAYLRQGRAAGLASPAEEAEAAAEFTDEEDL